MKKRFLYFFVLFTCVFRAYANEGMWLPLFLERLNYADMKEMGLSLTPEEIYSINHSSLKDAVVLLNDGEHSAEIISDQGLLLTSYRAAHPYIQKNSSVETDYLKDGFWAKNKKEELRNDNLSASVLIRIEDVTAQFAVLIHDQMDDDDRAYQIAQLSSELMKDATEGNQYSAKISSFFDGNEYYLIVFERFRDVRLVGAPPQQVAQFGGNTDSWMWPRHNADFALMRIYANPESNGPASYNRRNNPYKPRKFFAISKKGIVQDDFAIIMGYPKSSQRYITSYGIKMLQEQTNPITIQLLEKKFTIFKEAIETSEELKLLYSSKYTDASNNWKYFMGQSQLIDRRKLLYKKLLIENELDQWINQNPDRIGKYGNTLTTIQHAYDTMMHYNTYIQFFTKGVLGGPEIFSFMHSFMDLYRELGLKLNEEAITKMPNSLRYATKNFYKNYNIQVDKKLFVEIMSRFYKEIPASQRPEVFKTIEKKYKGDLQQFTDRLYDRSLFANKDLTLTFLMDPNLKTLEKDMGFELLLSCLTTYQNIIRKYNDAEQSLHMAHRLYYQACMEMEEDKHKFYPDANSTLRFTYGKVTNYNPTNYIKHKHYSTLEEMIVKENPDKEEFTLPDKLKKLYANRDFGTYGSDGDLNICFITNNDIVNGFSGAPVINGNGELIGICSDINWEGTGSPISFDPQFQRTINTDIRFVLFFIEKYGEAGNILKELTIL